MAAEKRASTSEVDSIKTKKEAHAKADVLEQQKLAIAHDADAKEFLANEKVAVSLDRQEKTKLATQKNIDDAAIRSKAKLRANGKRAA